MAALRCEIDRDESGRVIIGEKQISAIYDLLVEWHEEALVAAPAEQKSYVSLQIPEINVELSDGTLFKPGSISELMEIGTSKNGYIKKLSVGRYGGSGLVQFNTQSFLNPVTIKVKGQQDRAEFLVRRIQQYIRELEDFTVTVYKIPPFFIGLGIGILILASLYQFVLSKYTARDFAISFFWVPFNLGFLFAIFGNYLKAKWLPKVAFFWGYGERQLLASKSIVKVVSFIIPAWIITNVFVPIAIDKLK